MVEIIEDSRFRKDEYVVYYTFRRRFDNRLVYVFARDRINPSNNDKYVDSEITSDLKGVVSFDEITAKEMVRRFNQKSREKGFNVIWEYSIKWWAPPDFILINIYDLKDFKIEGNFIVNVKDKFSLNKKDCFISRKKGRLYVPDTTIRVSILSHNILKKSNVDFLEPLKQMTIPVSRWTSRESTRKYESCI